MKPCLPLSILLSLYSAIALAERPCMELLKVRPRLGALSVVVVPNEDLALSLFASLTQEIPEGDLSLANSGTDGALTNTLLAGPASNTHRVVVVSRSDLDSELERLEGMVPATTIEQMAKVYFSDGPDPDSTPRLSKWVSYAEAKRLAQLAKLTSRKQFIYWDRPLGVPKDVAIYYADKGWLGWEDFFGLSKWMSYSEAQTLIQAAGITTFEEFKQWRRPERFPSAPNLYYEGAGWEGWPAFFGRPHLRHFEWLSYDDAKRVAAEAGIDTFHKYLAWKKPEGMPSNPNVLYRDSGWLSWPDFFDKKKYVRANRAL